MAFRSARNTGESWRVSRLVGLEHASFEASRYAANMGPSVRHRTQPAFGIAHRFPLQAPPQRQPPVVSPAAPGKSLLHRQPGGRRLFIFLRGAARSRVLCPSTQTVNPRTRYVRHRTDCPHPRRYASTEVQTRPKNTAHWAPCSTDCPQDPGSSRPCFIYIWSQP